MTDTARRISASTANELIPVSGSGDELDLLANTLNEMFGRISEGLNRMRDFAANAAHQLRTPLSILRSRLEVALHQDRSLDEYRQVLEQTLAGVDVLSTEVNAMLEFARAEAGFEPSHMRRVSLDQELESIVEFFQPIAEEKGISLVCRTVRDTFVEGEPTWLHQLFANLIDNALKFTDRHGVVEVEVLRSNGQAVVKVSDDGIGMEPAELKRIFERFHRADQNGHRTGVGLGLPLAREIARSHRGNISAVSTLGKGSILTVELPRLQS
jgi:signal transduction histidine kinase